MHLQPITLDYGDPLEWIHLSIGAWMEEYFVHKCVTTDVVAANCEADGGDVVPQTISSWTSTGRCELVLVQESLQAHGASRAVLASILAMVSILYRTLGQSRVC